MNSNFQLGGPARCGEAAKRCTAAERKRDGAQPQEKKLDAKREPDGAKR